MVNKNAVQHSAANSVGGAARKNCLDFLIAAHETNSAERLAHIGWNSDSKFAQGFHAVWQKAFAAWLVYRGNCAIRDGDRQPAVSRGNRGGQTGGTSSNNEYINRVLRTHKSLKKPKPSLFSGLSDTTECRVIPLLDAVRSLGA